MPFINTLLLSCLVLGTSFTESGKRVSITRQQDEIILFFSIDNQSNPTCALRRCIDLTGPICDLLIFRATLARNCDVGNITLCLVELKGGDISKALKQLENTYNSLRRWSLFSDSPPITWKSYVMLQGGAPRYYKKARKDLTRKGLHVEIGRGGDIGNYIRRR